MESQLATQTPSESKLSRTSRLTFQIEPWANLVRDAQPLFKIHYEELALHKDKVPLGMDFQMYQDLENRGMLLVVTVRLSLMVVGYYIAIIIKNHPHNKTAGPVSTTDMFYVSPNYRRGGAGAKLLMFAENALRSRGVTKASLSTKLKFTNQVLLEALGWEATDLVFQKIL